MKFHLRRAVTALFVGALGVSTVANAALIDRGGGLIFDTDLNITWLADANYAMTSGFDVDGWMNFATAVTWADNLSYGGYTDWRLPTTLQPDATCSIQSGGVSSGFNCIGSEMGHLFYTEGVALFTNVRSDLYWSGTQFGASAWDFSFYNGYQGANHIDSTRAAWAVRDGDVAAASVPAVPVPAAAWLFGSGLAGLFGLARRSARPA